MSEKMIDKGSLNKAIFGVMSVLLLGLGILSFYTYRVHSELRSVRSQLQPRLIQADYHPRSLDWSSSLFSNDMDKFFQMNMLEPERMFEQMERQLQQMRAGFPNIANQLSGDLTVGEFKLSERDGEYIITFESPVIDDTKLNVNCQDQTLTISGEVVKQDNAKGTGRVYRQQSFSKTIVLPKQVVASQMKTEKQNGKVVITVPKADGARMI